MNYEEKQNMAIMLMKHFGVFQAFWSVSRPRFVYDEGKCPTAMVCFDRESRCVDFQINKNFWDASCDEKKCFVICHECLHVMLKHGKRGKSLLAAINADLVNAAMDAPINEMLVKYFGYNRSVVDPNNELVWANNLIEGRPDIPNILSFEEYFNLLVKECPNKTFVKVTDHKYLQEFDNEEIQKLLDICADAIPKEAKDFINDIASRAAGSETGNLIQYAKTPPPKPKKKWETVIKKWARRFIVKEKEEQHWLIKPRRTALLDYKSMFFPNDFEIDVKKNSNDKVDVWVFLDTSGSCIELKDRFFAAFESLPKDTFDVRPFCFDTKVFKLSEADIQKKKLYGFGGTTFSCIENYIQAQIKKEGKKFPNVFVITDGCASSFFCSQPKKWYFFLSQDTTYAIPQKAAKYLLENFE